MQFVFAPSCSPDPDHNRNKYCREDHKSIDKEPGLLFGPNLAPIPYLSPFWQHFFLLPNPIPTSLSRTKTQTAETDLLAQTITDRCLPFPPFETEFPSVCKWREKYRYRSIRSSSETLFQIFSYRCPEGNADRTPEIRYVGNLEQDALLLQLLTDYLANNWAGNYCLLYKLDGRKSIKLQYRLSTDRIPPRSIPRQIRMPEMKWIRP